MNNVKQAYIVERGNGLPSEGDHVVFGDVIYEVRDYIGPIMTDGLQGNYKLAEVKRIGDLLDEDGEVFPAKVWMVRYSVAIYDEDDMEIFDNINREYDTLQEAEHDYNVSKDDYHRLTIEREAYTPTQDIVSSKMIWDSAIHEVE